MAKRDPLVSRELMNRTILNTVRHLRDEYAGVYRCGSESNESLISLIAAGDPGALADAQQRLAEARELAGGLAAIVGADLRVEVAAIVRLFGPHDLSQAVDAAPRIES